MIKTVSMTITSPLIPELGAGLDRGAARKIPSFVVFRGVAVSELDAMKSIYLRCHSKRQVVGDFELEDFGLEGPQQIQLHL